MERRRASTMARYAAAGTCVAISLSEAPIGGLLALMGVFAGWQVVVGGAFLVAHSLAGFLLAEKLYSFPTVFAVRCGVGWSGLGLSATTTAILGAIVASQGTVDWEFLIGFTILFPVQVYNIIILAILARQQAISARW